jgi:branched-chain amino acid transport system substrate-binding protein
VAREFVKKYRAQFKTPPGYAPSAAYSMTRLMLAGFDKAKSVEVEAVIKALEGIEVNDLLGRMRVDGATHQTLRPYFFLRCKAKKDMKEELDLATVIATGDTPLPKEYAACKDIGPF